MEIFYYYTYYYYCFTQPVNMQLNYLMLEM